MRWKLLRRRLSISAPRVIVRSHLPWPLRWAVVAVALGFSAALALWAFEVGKEISGVDRHSKDDLARLRAEVVQLREERDKARSLAHAADNLLKAESAAQGRLAEQVRQLQADNMALKADLAFFERLLPAKASAGVSIRSLQIERPTAGQLRYQLLVMQSGKSVAGFEGRYELVVSGALDGRSWTLDPQPSRPIVLVQYARVEGSVALPSGAVVKTVQVRVVDGTGVVRATHTARM